MLIWVTIQIFTETASVSNVKKVKIWLFSEIAKCISNTELGQNQAFSEAASVTNAELGQNWAIFLNRIHFKCGLGSKSVFLLNRIRYKCGMGSKLDHLPIPHPSEMRKWVKIGLFTETASVTNAELGQNSISILSQ